MKRVRVMLLVAATMREDERALVGVVTSSGYDLALMRVLLAALELL